MPFEVACEGSHRLYDVRAAVRSHGAKAGHSDKLGKVRSIRNRLPALAFVWLCSQVAGLAAAPIVFACAADASESDLHECCKNLAPGQQCPMHHKPHDEPDDSRSNEPGACVMRSACAPTEAALLALAGTLGIPSTTALPLSRSGALPTAVAGSRTILRAETPTSPPPRSRS
jgi:hypothetical protein